MEICIFSPNIETHSDTRIWGHDFDLQCLQHSSHTTYSSFMKLNLPTYRDVV